MSSKKQNAPQRILSPNKESKASKYSIFLADNLDVTRLRLEAEHCKFASYFTEDDFTALVIDIEEIRTTNKKIKGCSFLWILVIFIFSIGTSIACAYALVRELIPKNKFRYAYAVEVFCIGVVFCVLTSCCVISSICNASQMKSKNIKEIEQRLSNSLPKLRPGYFEFKLFSNLDRLLLTPTNKSKKLETLDNIEDGSVAHEGQITDQLSKCDFKSHENWRVFDIAKVRRKEMYV